jgi:phage gpG-like protein
VAIRNFAGPGAFAAFLMSVPGRDRDNRRRAMDQAARLVQGEAQRMIGNYQPAYPPFQTWAPLAPSTIADKTEQGYAPPDNPLLRTGKLRRSIKRSVDADEASIGSDEDVAVWQELGTVKIPPRSFLGAAAVKNSDKVADILGKGATAALTGESPTSGRTDIDID